MLLTEEETVLGLPIRPIEHRILLTPVFGQAIKYSLATR